MHPETAQDRSHSRLCRAAAWEIVSFVIPFLVDLAIGAVILGGVWFFLWLSTIAKAFGLKAEHADAFE